MFLSGQALAEAHTSRYSSDSVTMINACTCPTEAISSRSEDLDCKCAVAAIEEVACLPFKNHELFMLVRELELQLEKERMARGQRDQPSEQGKANVSNTSNTGTPGGETESATEKSLDSLYTSQAYRMLAERSMDDGQAQEAAICFDKAYAQGLNYLPDRYSPLKNTSKYVVETPSSMSMEAYVAILVQNFRGYTLNLCHATTLYTVTQNLTEPGRCLQEHLVLTSRREHTRTVVHEN